MLSAGAKHALCSMASHDSTMVNPQAEAAAGCYEAYASQDTLWLGAGSTSALHKLIASTMKLQACAVERHMLGQRVCDAHVQTAGA